MAIEITKEDGITTITINRPERRNALDLPHMADLAAAWEEFRDDEGASRSSPEPAKTSPSAPT